MDVTLKHLRHVQLSSIGWQGQKKIQSTRLAIIGAGGLGTPAALYLASSAFLSLKIIDKDHIEQSNLSRQPLYKKEEIGFLKTDVLARRINELHSDVNVFPIFEYLSFDNIERLLSDVDIIVNASDNFSTRYLINKYALLTGKIWIDAGVDKHSGYICSFFPGSGCYSCLFPNQNDYCRNNCGSEGILSPLCGFFGSWLAVQCIQSCTHPYKNENIFFKQDLFENHFAKIHWKKNSQCLVCHEVEVKSKKEVITFDYAITKEEIISFFNPKDCLIIKFTLFDTLAIFHFKKSGNYLVFYIPIEDFYSINLEEPKVLKSLREFKQTRYICICENAKKSKIASELLRMEGFESYYLTNVT